MADIKTDVANIKNIDGILEDFTEMQRSGLPEPESKISKSKISSCPTLPSEFLTDVPVLTAPVPVPEKVAANAVTSLSNKTVTDYTASLWKYLPIPDTEPEPAPEYKYETISLREDRVKVTAARVRGKKHKHEGTNCDDWYEISSWKNILLIAVSDGAGSRKFSRIGARESCKAAVNFLVKSFEQTFSENPEIQQNLQLELSDSKCMDACRILAEIIQQSVLKAREAVETIWKARSTDPEYTRLLRRNLELHDFAGTLLVTALFPVNPADNQEYLVISCQVGDGMIALLNTQKAYQESLKLMGAPDSGIFSGETDFLTSAKMKTTAALQSRTKISRSTANLLFVMTDGVADDYFPYETELHRLYFDLLVNSVLEIPTTVELSELTQGQLLKLGREIPAPLAYPWVNQQKIQIAIQYTRRICEKSGLTLEDLWNNQTILQAAKLELLESNKSFRTELSPAERLKIWLDNYVERGSFDDRTLVIVQI